MAEIRTYRDEKRGQILSVSDLVYLLCSYDSSDNERADLIENIIGCEEFADAFNRVMAGVSDNESDTYGQNGSTKSGDKLRAIVAENAEVAAIELIKNLTNKILWLKNKLQDAENHNRKILEDWPESYRKYIPKSDWTYSESIGDDQVILMIENARAQQS